MDNKGVQQFGLHALALTITHKKRKNTLLGIITGASRPKGSPRLTTTHMLGEDCYTYPVLGFSYASNCCDLCQSPTDDTDTSSLLGLQAPLVDHIQPRLALSLVCPIQVAHPSQPYGQSHPMATGLQYHCRTHLQVTACPLHLHRGSPSALKKQLLLVEWRYAVASMASHLCMQL